MNSLQYRVLLPSLFLADPHLATDSHAVLSIRRLLFDSLIDFNGKLPRGNLAESWTVDDTGCRWQFRLKGGTIFPNGREPNAEDVAYSIARAASPTAEGQLYTVSYHSYLGKAIIDVKDTKTVMLTNPEPIADLPELLSDIVIMPKDWTDYNDGTGSGIYTVDTADSEKIVLQKRLPTESILPDRIIFSAEPDEKNRLEAVRAGDADLSLDPALGELLDIKAGATIEAIGWQTSLCVVFFMSISHPPLNDVTVRRAINIAVDTQSIIERSVHGRARRLNGPLSYRHLACDPDITPFSFDPMAARELLTQAGYGDGFPLTIHAPTTIPSEGPLLANAVAHDLKQVGIDAEIQLYENRHEYARMVAEKELKGLICFDSSPMSGFKVLKEKLDSRNPGPWWQGYSNPVCNRLLSEAAATTEMEKRKALYRKAYRIIRDDAPWLFLYSPERFWVARPRSITINENGFIET